MASTDKPLVHISFAPDVEGWVLGVLLPGLWLGKHQARTPADYEPGRPLLEELERAIVECRTTIVVVSPKERCDPLLEHVATLARHAAIESDKPRCVFVTRGVPRESLSLSERALVGLDCSNEANTGEALVRLRAMVNPAGPTIEPHSEVPACPYPGLLPFTGDGRYRLFGRDADRDAILLRIRSRAPRILVRGASGSGKSSLLHAAVLPALPPQDYVIAVVKGHSDLQAALRAKLPSLEIDRLGAILDRYRGALGAASDAEVEQARAVLDEVVVPDPRHRIVVIDSLEAIFIDHDAAQRKTFFDLLGALWSRLWCTVILCLRSDFLGALAVQPCWREIEGSDYPLRDLDKDGLRAAIIEPARIVDVHVDPALVERLIQEVAPDRSSSALPFLQVALKELWARLDHHYMALERYESIVENAPDEAFDVHTAAASHHRATQQASGLTAILSVHAGGVIQALSPPERDIAWRILLDLVYFGRGLPHARRERTREQLQKLVDNGETLHRVLGVLVDSRLVVMDAGTQPAPAYYLAHAALIHGWHALARRVAGHQADLSVTREVKDYERRRPDLLGTRIPRPHAMLAMVIGVLAVLGGWWKCSASQDMSACERAVAAASPRSVIAICLENEPSAADPDNLISASEAYLALGEFEQARTFARRLIGGPRDADGHRMLSNVILQAEPRNLAQARSEAAAAKAAYVRAGDTQGQIRGALALSRVSWKQGDFRAALDAADEALALIDRIGDSRHQVRAHLSRADVLHSIGDMLGARNELSRARELAITPCDNAWTYLKLGVHEATRDRTSAAEMLRVAEAANRDCARPDAAALIDLSIASLVRTENPEHATTKLSRSRAFPANAQASLFVRAQLAADRGALVEADRYFAQADAAAPDPDWIWKVATARAEIAELHGAADGDREAESHYRRAIDMIVDRRTQLAARALAMPVSHRWPFDGLMALYARKGRWHDLLAVILELQANDALRASPISAAWEAPHSAGSRSEAPAGPWNPATVNDVVAAWRSRDLVVVIALSPRQLGPPRERVYRVRLRDATVTGEDVGDAAAAAKWADVLSKNPNDRFAARALGHIIVPLGSSDQLLDVMTVGAISRAPLAALRDDDGSLIIGRRALARVLGLRGGAPSVDCTDAPVILVDPKRDLPGAAKEGAKVARILGPSAKLFGAGAGGPATLGRLHEARRAELLHVASRIGKDERWPTLPLQDKEIAPDGIVEAGIAPHLAVLAAAVSAMGPDDEHVGSLAAAFLEAGTSTVIATDLRLDDDASLPIMEAFYAERDWRTAPAQALTRTLLAASTKDASGAWAAFIAIRRPPHLPKEERK
jgi:tetratricopeptide (TPR) repeat protein